MKLNLLCVGRMTLPYLNEGCTEFADRLKRNTSLNITEIKEFKTGRKLDLPRIVEAEAERLTRHIAAGTSRWFFRTPCDCFRGPRKVRE